MPVKPLGQKPQRKAKDIRRKENRDCPKSETGFHVFVYGFDNIGGAVYVCQFCRFPIQLPEQITKLDDLEKYV